MPYPEDDGSNLLLDFRRLEVDFKECQRRLTKAENKIRQILILIRIANKIPITNAIGERI